MRHCAHYIPADLNEIALKQLNELMSKMSTLLLLANFNQLASRLCRIYIYNIMGNISFNCRAAVDNS